MKFALPTLILSTGLLTAGCVVIDADSDDDFDFSYSNSGYERVYAAEVSDAGISLTVASSGCTSREFFSPDIDDEGSDEFEIGFERVRADYCKALVPNGETLKWSFQELGLPEGAQVTLLNPVGR